MLPRRRLAKLKKTKEAEGLESELMNNNEDNNQNEQENQADQIIQNNNNNLQPEADYGQYYQNNNNSNNINNNLDNNQNNHNELQPEHPGPRSHLPEFLRAIDNDQLLQTYQRMRDRNLLDGAVQLNVEPDDIANDNIELYDNKGINLDLPLLNEHLAREKEYYIQSISKDRYYKIPKEGIEKLEKRGKIQKKVEVKKEEGRVTKALDVQRETEDEIFNNFDKQLKQVINDLSNKITLLFLVVGGFLAGR
jgi:hypothetical protein